MYSCLLCKLKNVPDIFTNFHTNIKHYETMCRILKRNSGLLTFGVIAPFNIEHSHFYHVLMSALKVENGSRYFDETSHKCKAP